MSCRDWRRGLTNGSTYYFTVKAVNAQGQGAAPGEIPAIPVTVPGAPAPASGGARIRGYIIYQGTSPGDETGTPVNGSQVTATSYTVTGLTVPSGCSCCYRRCCRTPARRPG